MRIRWFVFFIREDATTICQTRAPDPSPSLVSLNLVNPIPPAAVQRYDRNVVMCVFTRFSHISTRIVFYTFLSSPKTRSRYMIGPMTKNFNECAWLKLTCSVIVLMLPVPGEHCQANGLHMITLKGLIFSVWITRYANPPYRGLWRHDRFGCDFSW